MFGYVTVPLESLTEEQRTRYQRVYCGLCRQLGKRHGAAARLSLTYDLTFLTLLLQSLYEPDETEGKTRCPRHAVKPRGFAVSEITAYAADLTVVLTWYKCMDDWQDERSAAARVYASSLRKAVEQVRQRLPRQCERIDECMQIYGELERNAAPGSALCDCFGQLMSELFVWREDEWTPALRSLGGDLGRMICLMDAAVDYDRDLRRKKQNLLRSMNMQPEEARELLKVLAGRVTAVLERLPLVQDLDLLRSILYGGIWQRYDAAMLKRQKTKEPSQEPSKDEGDRT